MKLAKKILLVILSTIPLPMAVSFAAEYSENVETPSVTLINITAEFLRRFERNLLDAKYIEYLEENDIYTVCLLYTSPSPRDQRGSRMPSSA